MAKLEKASFWSKQLDCEFELTYRGGLADRGMLQFYDVSHALWGFERAISITTHLLVNGTVITQSPSAKGFFVVVVPPEPGSWKWKVMLGFGSIVSAFGLAPPDTAFGWLAKSAIEYVIEETLGFEPNFEESLGNQIESFREREELRKLPEDLSQSRFDAVIEKCENGIRSMHRPIAFSETADVASISWKVGPSNGTFKGYFDNETFEHMAETKTIEDIKEFRGYVSSYNSNTFSGRLYLPSTNRTVPFKFERKNLTVDSVRLITSSLRENAIARRAGALAGEGDVTLRAFRNESSTGRLKSLYGLEVLNAV